MNYLFPDISPFDIIIINQYFSDGGGQNSTLDRQFIVEIFM